MLLMAVASPLVAIHYSTIYLIVPALMLFGLASPVTLTPILPEMGEVVDALVSVVCVTFAQALNYNVLKTGWCSVCAR